MEELWRTNVLTGSKVFAGKSQTKVKLSHRSISNGNALVTRLSSAVNETGPMFEIFNGNTVPRLWLINSLLYDIAWKKMIEEKCSRSNDIRLCPGGEEGEEGDDRMRCPGMSPVSFWGLNQSS